VSGPNDPKDPKDRRPRVAPPTVSRAPQAGPGGPRTSITEVPGRSSLKPRSSLQPAAGARTTDTKVQTVLDSVRNAAAGGNSRSQRDEAEVAESIVQRSRMWTLITELHTLMKSVMLHDSQHAVARQMASGLCNAIAAMPPPFVVQFVAGGVFLDRRLIPLDFHHFERCLALTRALRKLGAHELTFEAPLSLEAAQRLGQALAAGSRGQGDNLKGVEIPGMAWREIPHAQSGIDAEGVDPEVAAVAHTVLGISVAEQIAATPNQPWPWNLGLAVVRRLEKGLATKPGASMRVVEFAPEGWPVARRAVSAAQLVLQVLTKCNTDASNRRAVAHATLALALQGLQPRDGLDIAQAADSLGSRMMSAPIQAKSGIAPQCLLVASLVHAMGSEMRRQKIVSLAVTELVELAYDMERSRCPADVPFDLTRADLLAYAVSHRVSPDWVRAVIKICGAVPVGACVQLRDGRVGIVIEPGPPHQPWCPVVFVDGARVAAREPVMLVPPHKLRRLDAGAKPQTRLGTH
jgi:hypothetical protein